jgi:hypothetical protein
VLGVIIVKEDLFLLLGSVVTTVDSLGRGSRSCSLLLHRYERRKEKTPKKTDKQLGSSWLRKGRLRGE